MPTRASLGRRLDVVVILGLLGIFLFASPLINWWAQDNRPWYLPYLLWLVAIGAAIWVQRIRARYEG